MIQYDIKIQRINIFILILFHINYARSIFFHGIFVQHIFQQNLIT